MRHAEDIASCDKTTGQGMAAPRPAGTAGSAARSAQVPEAGAAGLQTAGRDGRARRQTRAGKAVNHRQRRLTWADAQSVYGIAQLKRAADAFNATQKEVAQAVDESEQAFEYLQLAFILLLQGCCDDAYAAAQQLYCRASAWRAAQEGMYDSQDWAVNKTLAQLNAIGEAWERELEGSLSGLGVGGEVEEQAEVPAGACAVLQRYSGGFACVQGCLETMHKRVAGYVRSTTAQKQDMAAATYMIIRQVRCTTWSCYEAC